MTETVVARSARLGDICLRDIPRLLTKEEIRDLSRIDSVKFTLAAVLEYGLIAAAIWISWTWWNPVSYVLAVIVVGSRINGLGGLMHDAAHYRAYTNRALNDFVGEIFGVADLDLDGGLSQYAFCPPSRAQQRKRSRLAAQSRAEGI